MSNYIKLFKEGDKIVCIDNTSGIANTHLILGKVYTVKEDSSYGFVALKEVASMCRIERFVPYAVYKNSQEPRKVRKLIL